MGALRQVNHNGVRGHARIPIEAWEQMFAPVAGRPVLLGFAQPLAPLPRAGLRRQRQRQPGMAKVRMEGAAAVPPHGLAGAAELFRVPAVRIVLAQLFEFVPLARGRKRAVAVVVGGARNLRALGKAAGWSCFQSDRAARREPCQPSAAATARGAFPQVSSVALGCEAAGGAAVTDHLARQRAEQRARQR